MHFSVSKAKGQLTELVKRAEQGEEIVLTRHGRPVVKLQPTTRRVPTGAERRAILDAIRKSAAGKALPGPDAARSQDFLYDEDGLPG